MERIIQEKLFCFLDNCIWIGYQKFSILQRDYLSSADNVLPNIPIISDITKRDILELYFSHKDEKISLKCCLADFNSLWYPWACWISNGILKHGFLDIYLTI